MAAGGRKKVWRTECTDKKVRGGWPLKKKGTGGEGEEIKSHKIVVIT